MIWRTQDSGITEDGRWRNGKLPERHQVAPRRGRRATRYELVKFPLPPAPSPATGTLQLLLDSWKWEATSCMDLSSALAHFYSSTLRFWKAASWAGWHFHSLAPSLCKLQPHHPICPCYTPRYNIGGPCPFARSTTLLLYIVRQHLNRSCRTWTARHITWEPSVSPLRPIPLPITSQRPLSCLHPSTIAPKIVPVRSSLSLLAGFGFFPGYFLPAVIQ